jgi:hypothetical protein
LLYAVVPLFADFTKAITGHFEWSLSIDFNGIPMYHSRQKTRTQHQMMLEISKRLE